MKRLFASPLLMFSCAVFGQNKQSVTAGLEHLVTVPLNYTARFVNKPPVIDGVLDDIAWQQAAWTDLFADIEGDKRPKPRFDTRVKMAWDDSCLYIAASLNEPHVWATLKKRDEVIFNDNDFEVFIDPDNNTHHYYEIEVNALNTIFDLFMPKPYRNGSGAMIPYDTPGMRSAVKINGTLNNPSDVDEGWTVEMAIPFRAVSMGNDTRVPAANDVWRINFSRVEWDIDVIGGKYSRKVDAGGKRLPEHNWVWSPQGVVNMHYPERWGYLRFSRSEHPDPFILSFAEQKRRLLWVAYYRQKEYFEKFKRYTSSPQDLGLTAAMPVEGKACKFSIEATSRQFTAKLDDGGSSVFIINDEGLILIEKN